MLWFLLLIKDPTFYLPFFPNCLPFSIPRPQEMARKQPGFISVRLKNSCIVLRWSLYCCGNLGLTESTPYQNRDPVYPIVFCLHIMNRNSICKKKKRQVFTGSQLLLCYSIVSFHLKIAAVLKVISPSSLVNILWAYQNFCFYIRCYKISLAVFSIHPTMFLISILGLQQALHK